MTRDSSFDTLAPERRRPQNKIKIHILQGSYLSSQVEGGRAATSGISTVAQWLEHAQGTRGAQAERAPAS